MENTLQTVLTISNTDIVTMLIVKQKKELKSRVPDSTNKKIGFIIKICERLEENLQQRWDENNQKTLY
jgi:rRNA processing protein Gar1